MAAVGAAKKRKPLSNPSTFMCLRCGEKVDMKKYYGSQSMFYTTYMKVPYCQDCLDDMYLEYYEKYENQGYTNPDRKAVERICMVCDVYYSDKIFDSALKGWEKDGSKSLMSYYLQRTRLRAYINKTYDNTLVEKFEVAKNKDAIMSIYNDDDAEQDKRISEGVKMFGSGFDREDYVYLYNKYMDWTARHECNTMSQEENFKRICIVQLQLLKADRAGDTQAAKQLNETYLKLTDAAKLQPKQNAGDTTADNQTLGTLIDKWENTRPIPECDDELKDVDRIGLYIDVFFRGHLAKMVGIKNALSNLYDKFISRYTANKPEYVEDEDTESLFDVVFGSASLEQDEDELNTALGNYAEEEVV